MPDLLIIPVSPDLFEELAARMPVHSVGGTRWILGTMNGVHVTFVVRPRVTASA